MDNQKSKNKATDVSVSILSPSEFSLQLKNVEQEAFATWIRALLQNWRQGTVGYKTRAEVSYSRKKPWKQKGTGRARVGSARSPLWRHGGTMFGPEPRVRTLKIAKNVRSAVLNDMFFHAMTNKNVLSFDWILAEEAPKTQKAVNALRAAGMENNKILLLLTAHDALHYASFVNLPNVRIAFFDQLNAYDIAAVEKIVCLKKDIDVFKNMVASWN